MHSQYDTDILILGVRSAGFGAVYRALRGSAAVTDHFPSAASGARLSRTMLQLGEAAERAASLCIREGCIPRDVDAASLCK